MLVEPPPTTDDLLHGRALARSGRITEALLVLDSVLADATDPHRLALALVTVVDCRLARGDLDPATLAAHQLVALAAGHRSIHGLAQLALGDVASARGEHEAAAARYAEAGDSLDEATDDPELVPWRAGAALALARLGARAEAAELARQHLDLARTRASPHTVSHALRTMAATTWDGSSLSLLREARTALAGVDAERLAAQIDADLAVLLTLQGDSVATAEAVGLLRIAEEYAGREDLFPLQDRVRRLLIRLGEQPCRIRSETLASLTASEQRAARLAAGGMTNREIAVQMRVTVKAVEWHLSHVYRKLDIPGRGALAESLGAPV